MERCERNILRKVYSKVRESLLKPRNSLFLYFLGGLPFYFLIDAIYPYEKLDNKCKEVVEITNTFTSLLSTI